MPLDLNFDKWGVGAYTVHTLSGVEASKILLSVIHDLTSECRKPIHQNYAKIFKVKTSIDMKIEKGSDR